ncbi:MAG: hypothetical protein ABIS86_24040 [Streptosporangiaceae bacterium]
MRHSLGLCLAVALTLLPALAGCSGDRTPQAQPAAPATSATTPGAPTAAPSSVQPAPPAPAPTAVRTAVLNAFTACMRKEGIPIPDGATDSWTPGPDVDPAQAQKAVITCVRYATPPS